MTSRFAPTRAGIVNLWDYVDEEFSFVDGRLVLRGPNGSGKTKALEVLFPFVLDGRIEPRRLNPFAGEDRTMKSNILYRGQEKSHAYVWMEFGDGERYVTIGIGLSAHRHQDKVVRWHFVTDGRVGVHFSLLDADDRPLNRRGLIDGLGAEAVCDRATEYREKVNNRLFGLDRDRYEQMLDLVLTLRRPQLAKHLDPVELSRTLQRGLRPLDDALLSKAAVSFDDLAAVARVLDGLVASDEATQAFLGVYTTYLRTHARSAADALDARLDTVTRTTAERDRAGEALALAEEALVSAERKLAAAEGEPGRLRAHRDGLKESKAYQSVGELADLRRLAISLADRAGQAAAAADTAASTAATRKAEADAAAAERDRAGEVAARAAQRLSRDAEDARIPWEAEDAVPDGFGARSTSRVTARREDLRVVREQAAAVADAEKDRARAEQETQRVRSELERAEQVSADADAAAVRTRTELRDRIASWAEPYTPLLSALDAAELPARLAEAVDTVGEPGAHSSREVFDEAVRVGLDHVRGELADLSAASKAVRGERERVSAERDQIAAEKDDAPPLAHTRPDRAEQADGAPLWRLVNFAEGVDEPVRAGVESALEAAGLLDAWVHRGEVAADVQDGRLVPLPAARRPAGRTLADVLVAERQDEVPVARVAAVLASIALGDGPDTTGVDEHGRYRIGVRTGRFTKSAPEFIGATARAARRAARIAACEERIGEFDARLYVLDGRVADLENRLADAHGARSLLPSQEPVVRALREADRAAAALPGARARSEAADAALDEAVASLGHRAAGLRRTSAERRLPAEALDSIAAAVATFERTALAVSSDRAAAQVAARAADGAAARLTEAANAVDTARENAVAARAEAEEQRERLEVLEETLGAEADKVLDEIEKTERLIVSAERVLRELNESRSLAQVGKAHAETGLTAAEEARGVAVHEARETSVRLRPFAHADLLGLLRCPVSLRWPAESGAGEDLPAEVAELLAAIKQATRELAPTDNSRKQTQTRVIAALSELEAQLPAAGLDHRPEWDHDDGVIVVRVRDDEGLSPVARFAERIAAQREEQSQLLTETEQRVLEDALLTELARQMHRRTVEARDLVHEMDRQMRARRMSSGLAVGVGWQLSDELDPDQRRACKLLDGDPARLSPNQLDWLRGHFSQRIKQARAVRQELSYRELLGEVLDYRTWRAFAFSLHTPTGQAEALTRARHSKLSGGEQSVSLHLPLFAAANAVFGSARADAPRLLGLDEAFAGVDETGRGELLSLAARFDLDLFMTGYDLWAVHESVPGCAHYDLAHSSVEHAVSTMLMVWDAGELVTDLDGGLAASLGSPGLRRIPRQTGVEPPSDAVPMDIG